MVSSDMGLRGHGLLWQLTFNRSSNLGYDEYFQHQGLSTSLNMPLTFRFLGTGMRNISR